MSVASRLQNLQATLAVDQIALLSDPDDIFYFAGFESLTTEREAFLAITAHTTQLFLTAFSAAPQESSELQAYFLSSQKTLSFYLKTLIEKDAITSLLFDENDLTVQEFNVLSEKLGALVGLHSLPTRYTAQFRTIKDDTEVARIKKANHLTHQALQAILPNLKVGQTEREVKKNLEEFLQHKGVEKMAFPTIVAFDEHTALPHHQPTDRKLKMNQPVLIDIGAKWDNYCADVTRTIWFGDQPDEEFVQIEDIVKEAYRKTYHRLTHRESDTPLLAKELDRPARSHIEMQGFGERFIHTTGHGVGLYIHEQPSLNWRNEMEIRPKMVITIEPGIYLEGKFGYRFENSILVTEDGAEELL